MAAFPAPTRRRAGSPPAAASRSGHRILRENGRKTLLTTALVCGQSRLVGWACSSAGEHFVDIEGVTGSIPVTPTIRTFPKKTPAPLLESNVMFDARHSRSVSAPTGRFSTRRLSPHRHAKRPAQVSGCDGPSPIRMSVRTRVRPMQPLASPPVERTGNRRIVSAGRGIVWTAQGHPDTVSDRPMPAADDSYQVCVSTSSSSISRSVLL